MAFDMEGLMDFGTGAFQGGAAGAQAGAAGGPWGTAIGAGVGALGLGALSYFGGAPGRRLEKKANALSLKSMEQDLELGEFSLSEARRKRSYEMDEKKKREIFGRLLAQYFQRKQGGA